MQRAMGRILISAAAVQTVVVPVLAEWSAGAGAGDRRPRAARARGVVSLAMNGAVAPVALWMIWRRRSAAGGAACS